MGALGDSIRIQAQAILTHCVDSLPRGYTLLTTAMVSFRIIELFGVITILPHSILAATSAANEDAAVPSAIGSYFKIA